MGVWIVMPKPDYLQTAPFSCKTAQRYLMYIHIIYQVYTMYIHDIYQSDESWKSATLQGRNGCLKNFKWTYIRWHNRRATQFYTQNMFYWKTGYAMYIQCIYHVYNHDDKIITGQGHTRALLVAHPRLAASDRDFNHREPAHARLGPAKVPQPGVDLVDMAAPPRCRASSISTAALKESFCLLLYLCGIVEVAFPSR